VCQPEIVFVIVLSFFFWFILLSLPSSNLGFVFALGPPTLLSFSLSKFKSWFRPCTTYSNNYLNFLIAI
jgi:hypothetical protein